MTSTGATTTVITESAASGGSWVQLNSDAVGDFVEFTTGSVTAGTYSVKLAFKSNTTRGQLALTVDGAAVGGTVDQYAGAIGWPAASTIGTVTFGTTGTHKLRLTVSGKNAAATGFILSADRFDLVAQGAVSSSFEAESLAVTSTGAATSVLNETAASGGSWVQLNSDTVGDFMEFTTGSVAAGSYSVQLAYKANSTRGQLALTVDGAAVGGTVDQYASAIGWPAASTIGTVTFSTTGTHKLRLTVTGKNAASTGFLLSADKFNLVAQTAPPPAAPTGLTATATSGSQINLAWTGSSGATSYNVKRSTTSGGSYATVATGLTTTSNSDTGLASGTTYFYVVSAVSANGESANSTQASATTVNTPPTISAIADPAAVLEDSGLQTVNFSGVTAGGTDTQALSVTAVSANSALIPTPTVTYTSPNTTGSVKYTPVANASGSAVITVTVSDGISSTSTSFTVNVTAVNDAPTISAIANPPAIANNAGAQTVNFSGVTAGGGESQTLTVTAVSANTSVIPNPTVTYTSANSTGSLSFTPVANAVGTAMITVTVNDGAAANNTATRSFTVTVTNGAMTGVQAIIKMTRGMNLGRCLELPLESQGKHIEQFWFTDMKTAGFNFVRIPIQWDKHLGTTSPYTVDSAFLDRVQQVVGWALAQGFIVIINSHHDTWIENDASLAGLNRFKALWTQIAARFQNTSENLLFEIMNEPALVVDSVNTIDNAIFPIIRATNPTRIILFGGPGQSYNRLSTCTYPANDPYLIGQFHTYAPTNFTINGVGTWGTAADYAAMDSIMDTVESWSQSSGIAVLLGEFGTVSSCDKASRERWYMAVADKATQRLFAPCIWQDFGSFNLYNPGANPLWSYIKDDFMSVTVPAP